MTNAVSTKTIEIVMYRAKPEVSDAHLTELSDGFQRELDGFPGYIRRRLLKDDDGIWIDIVDWNSMEEAMRASEQINASPLAAAFGELVEGESVKVMHLSPVRVYAGNGE